MFCLFIVAASFSKCFCSLFCTESPDLANAPKAAAKGVTKPSSVAAVAGSGEADAEAELGFELRSSSGKELKLWRLDDKFYNLIEFAPTHPGGEMAIAHGMGTDISASFHSHHLRPIPEAILAKYRVTAPPPEAEKAIPSCGYTFEEGGFFRTLKHRVAKLDLDKQGYVSWVFVFELGAVFATFLGTWLVTCFRAPDHFTCAAAIINASTRMYIIGVGHEVIHGRVQNWFTFQFFDAFMLLPSRAWHREHVLEHHPHTKRFGLDPDEILDPFRICYSVTKQWYHWLQVPLSLLLVFATQITWIDKRFVQRELPFTGFVYLLALHLLPFFTQSSKSDAFYMMMLSVGLANLVTVTCFHISHINENNAAHTTMLKGKDWGAHQLQTTSNFRAFRGHNFVFPLCTGMLELQNEHHLFPRLSYADQYRIKPLVLETAKEFGVPYFEYPTIYHGSAAHLYHMHLLARSA